MDCHWRHSHPWLRFTPNANTATITATATANTKVQVTGSSGGRTLSLVAEQPRTISVRGETTLALTEPVGITEIDAGIHRIVDVPGTADTYFFQRLMPETTTLQRAFTTADDRVRFLVPVGRVSGTGCACIGYRG